MSDAISDFVEQSHTEQGQRTELRMRKEMGGAGFCTYKNITVGEHDGWCGLMPE